MGRRRPVAPFEEGCAKGRDSRDRRRGIVRGELVGGFSSSPLGALLDGSVYVLFEQPGDVWQNLEFAQFATVMVFSKQPLEVLEGDPVLSTEVGVDVARNRFRGLMTSKDARSEAVERLSTAYPSVERPGVREPPG